MANGINNKYEYRSGLLDSLNVQHTASDVRNEDEYRKKVLNGLGVEYTEDDINQKNLYRAKVVEGLASSGGGETWNTVFEGDVTIQQGSSLGITIGAMLSGADKIKVTFNGAEYECEKKVTESDGTYYGADPNDFSVYPFSLVILPTDTILFVETAGTYSLKIEEPQSGGSSDFSTAEITFSGINGTAFATMPKIIDTPFDAILPLQNEVADGTYTIALYKGKVIISLDLTGVEGNATTSGDIELLEGTTYLVTGDCTITIS